MGRVRHAITPADQTTLRERTQALLLEAAPILLAADGSVYSEAAMVYAQLRTGDRGIHASEAAALYRHAVRQKFAP